MLFSQVSIAFAVSIFAVAEAGLYSLPITRTTVGLSFEFLDVSKQAEKHRSQSTLGTPASRIRHLSEGGPQNQDNFFASIFQRAFHARNLVQERLDDDDGDIDVMFWSMYTTPVSVGNPPLNLDAIVDTSWSPLFIPSVNCTYDPHETVYCIWHPLYNSSLSSTYRPDLTPSTMAYTGPAGLYTWGKISQDSLHVAGMEIEGQIFEEVTVWRPDYGTFDDYWDTALGLALFKTLEGDRWGNFTAPSPFHNMIEQKLLDENLVTLRYARTDQERGEITLGGLPENLHREEMIEVPLNHSRTEDGDHVWRFYTMNGWQVSMQGMSMASNLTETIVPVLDQPQIAVISSSFPWIGLPDEAAENANTALGLKHWLDWLDCDTRANLPNWTITFGADDQTISLTPWDYLIEVYDEQLKCVSAFFELGEYGDKGFILLGAPFLNGLYSVFDADRKSISFSNRAL